MTTGESEEAPGAGAPICAIGASAGGLAALRALFGALRPDVGFAYVVVMHLAPDHPSALADILARETAMPVETIGERAVLRPNRVYVAPPDRRLRIEDGAVATETFDAPRGLRHGIDRLFESLAGAGGRGVAVILSGEGADGAAGARAVREAGGLVLAQSPEEAEHRGMPEAAIAARVVDVDAPAAELAERLTGVAGGPGLGPAPGENLAEEEDIRRVIAILRQRAGHDFAQYKRATLRRRIARRMQVVGVETLAAYADRLITDKDEPEALFRELLIGVTAFFRDPAAFEALAREAIGPLFDRAEARGAAQIRAWSVGCATGEEAYSVAMLLLEEAARRGSALPVQVFATDIDDVALAVAREGLYGPAVETDVGADRLRRFFLPEGEDWRVRQSLRDAVVFARHDVLKDPPFMHIDLVTCRNLLIYLERDTQRRVCATLRYALDAGGFLMLGAAETAEPAQDMLRSVDREARLYVAEGDAVPAAPPPAGTDPAIEPARPTLARRPSPAEKSAGAVHLAALERATPPSALVDRELRALHLSPSAGRFLAPSGGPPSLELPALARPELRLDLRIALHRLFDRGEPTLTLPVLVAFNGTPRRVMMQVAPDPNAEAAAPRALVFFLDGGPAEAAAEEEEAADGRAGETRRLREELRAAQERLAASRGEHEQTVQELRAANEEFQSINEEYRSTSEELETSKEELQSMNEELQTLNAELKSKLETVSTAHNDLRNLVDAAEFGTLFLDTGLKIRMFTPRVREVFNLSESDIGRPITDFANRLEDHDVEADARAVLRDLASIRRDLRTTDGRWLSLIVRPYRTLEERIEGVVVTFSDVTEARETTERLRVTEERFVTLMRATNDAVYRMGPDWSELLMLDGGGFLADASEPLAGWMERYVPEDARPEVSAAIRDAVARKGLFELEHPVLLADGGRGWALSRAAPILDPDGVVREWFGVASDVTERRRAEETQKLLIAELNHRVKNLLTVILSIADQTRRDAPSPDAFAEAFEDRLHALAEAHDALTQGGWRTVALGDLAAGMAELFDSEQRGRVAIEGPILRLGANAATTMALALHELATNALKHGALSGEAGRVDLRWRIEPGADDAPGRLVLTWRESGGPPASPPPRRGFGSRLLEEGLPEELGGAARLDFAPEGLRYTLEAPLSDQLHDG